MRIARPATPPTIPPIRTGLAGPGFELGTLSPSSGRDVGAPAPEFAGPGPGANPPAPPVTDAEVELTRVENDCCDKLDSAVAVVDPCDKEDKVDVERTLIVEEGRVDSEDADAKD